MDSTKALASLSFHDLSESIQASGLIPDDELASVLAEANGDPLELARVIAARQLLTPFQFIESSEGRGASLRVGNYDILDRLGAGGMGTVFRARHRRMKRVVALKVLAANLSKDQVFVKRFQREVETIACLGHPNVVMAYDADEAEVGYFLVMELVDGLDLAASVAREGTFSLARAVDCILQAARGLAYAHSQGIIHRDIKPHNLLRDANGVVKLTDLGLARLNHGVSGPASGMDVTMAGGVVGTADYMPPEQAFDATTIDHRADIYSLGCTLHFLLTGKPPYSGPTFMAILLKHRDAEIPSLTTIRPETPLQLNDLFRRMLAKQPEQRVQSMSEVVAELESIAKSIAPDDSVNLSSDLTVYLPADSQPLSGSGSTVSTDQLSSPTLAAENFTAPVTVLVVEPSRVQSSIIKNYLQEQSLSVVGAVTNGRNAIEAVRSLRPRAVISAMYLSDMNGIELAQSIRSEIQVDAPGFLLITSASDEGESSSLSKLKRVLLLQKPFTSNQMLDALNQVTGAAMDSPSATPFGIGRRNGGKIARDQLRVLIVDDSSTARMCVRSVLQGLGFTQFIEVPDGAHAIAVAAREICHLIVTDYNMPLMDGRALVSYLKQNSATASIPIIMVTTETEPRLLDAVRKLGVVEIVDKTFPVSVVRPILDSLF